MIIDFNIQRNLNNNELIQNIAYSKQIKGQVKKQNIIFPTCVFLYERLSNRLVDQVETDLDGRYVFKNLGSFEFFIVAHDQDRQFNAVIQDNVVPK